MRLRTSNTRRASLFTTRSSSRWRKRCSVSVSPCHLSGSGRRPLPSSVSSVGPTDSSPVLRRHHRAGRPDPVTDIEQVEQRARRSSSRLRVGRTAAGRPRSSRSTRNSEPPELATGHHAACDGDDRVGLGGGAQPHGHRAPRAACASDGSAAGATSMPAARSAASFSRRAATISSSLVSRRDRGGAVVLVGHRDLTVASVARSGPTGNGNPTPEPRQRTLPPATASRRRCSSSRHRAARCRSAGPCALPARDVHRDRGAAARSRQSTVGHGRGRCGPGRRAPT
jgi:hypothetical protein